VSAPLVEIEQRLNEALSRPTSKEWLTVHVPAPLGSLESLLAARPEEVGFVWAPPDDVQSAAIGTVWSCVPSTLPAVREEAAAVLSRLEERGAAPSTRVFGALPFLPMKGEADAISRGLFFIPRWRYLIDGDQAWLSLTLSGNERADEGIRRALIREGTALAAALETKRAPSKTTARVLSVDRGDTAAFEAGVATAVADMVSGRFEKVVLARSTKVTLDSAPSPVEVLERLAADGGWGNRYALRLPSGSYVALMPERLVQLRGKAVTSEALAGTVEAQEGAAREWLAASRKDAIEHGWVVRAIAETLDKVCVRLSVPERPGMRALRHVIHLLTPIEGELREPGHVLALVEALHPTPAVGGTPQDTALSWIESHEPEQRGLYAGPCGWFDAAGDGDFWVALRGGYLRGSTAVAWSGVGLVRDSNPAAELHETEVKQRGFLRAVGVAP
jgi:menaquinone-specific isochorismate synthase